MWTTCTWLLRCRHPCLYVIGGNSFASYHTLAVCEGVMLVGPKDIHEGSLVTMWLGYIAATQHLLVKFGLMRLGC